MTIQDMFSDIQSTMDAATANLFAALPSSKGEQWELSYTNYRYDAGTFTIVANLYEQKQVYRLLHDDGEEDLIVPTLPPVTVTLVANKRSDCPTFTVGGVVSKEGIPISGVGGSTADETAAAIQGALLHAQPRI